ncbi:MAG: hypothetical protein WC299_06990 [Kiritimatiellia bacterium]
MKLNKYLSIDGACLARFQDLYARYRLLYDDPENCSPMIIVNTPSESAASWEDRLSDPLVMLKEELDSLRPHLEMGDDRVPTVRVQFGTAQVAAAFGCAIYVPKNSLPAAGSHVLETAADARGLKMPALDSGWYGKLAEWTEIWKKNLPQGIHIQHPDIQSAFNSAHLIRGNDILTDFYDSPGEVDILLDKVTDFMLAITRHVKSMISNDHEWFFDWGAMWKGAARISNCSMQMISPELYRKHVLPRDIRFFESIGGGRMHYCGITGEVTDDFLKVPLLSGLDFDCSRHDFHEICRHAPRKTTLVLSGIGEKTPQLERLLKGDWPAKRNIVVIASAGSFAAGQTLLGQLRDSIPC